MRRNAGARCGSDFRVRYIGECERARRHVCINKIVGYGRDAISGSSRRCGPRPRRRNAAAGARLAGWWSARERWIEQFKRDTAMADAEFLAISSCSVKA